jgi:hypothetical protein
MMWIALGQTGVDCQCPGGITACQALMEITMRQMARIRDVIKNGFADPDFGPYEVAAKAGIRYVTYRSSLPSNGLTLQRIHLFGSFGSRCASSASQSVIGHKPVSQRNRLRFWL